MRVLEKGESSISFIISDSGLWRKMEQAKLNFNLIKDGNISSEIVNDDILNYLEKNKEKKFKLIITSPPYNIGKAYEKKQPLNEYLKWQEEIISQLSSILLDDGSIIWQVGNYVDNGEVYPLDIYFYHIFKQFNFKLRNRIIWHFEHGLHCTHRFSGRYETLIWFTKTDNYTFNLDDVRVPSKYPGKLHYKGPNKGKPSGNPKGKNPSDYWKIMLDEYQLGVIDIPNVKCNHPEKTEHPCQFPIELIERCILACTNENDYVLDPFGGVGTTLLASIKNHRNAVSVDLNKKYSDIARERLRQLLNGELKFRPLGKSIYKPSGNEKVTKIPEDWGK